MSETESAEAAASRLEAALERIAQRTAVPSPTAAHAHDTSRDPPIEEIAARLDALIDRLRSALNSRTD
ncbi:MAG: hypothetical protein JO227_19845 [Acetobacteraceae bacterium]|nr:hypothetical protein [Acetobacteraceae bacterium]